MTFKIHCPFCGEKIEVCPDEIEDGDTWIEDCEVCCHPMQLRMVISERGRKTVEADQA